MRPNKYLNRKTEVEGITFDSKKEASYWLYLRQLEKNGEISNLRRQVSFEVIPAVYGERVVRLKTKEKRESYCIQRAACYVADFVYVETATGKQVVVDVKSPITRKNPEYRLKKKMMLAFNGIEVTEI